MAAQRADRGSAPGDLVTSRRAVLAGLAGTLAACAPGARAARPDARVAAAPRATPGPRVVRVPARCRAGVGSRITPLVYGGGFDAKTALYETLVRLDDAGRLAPGLASAWEWRDAGRSLLLTLRPGACFHDGEPVTAEAVGLHFRRWVGLPEHGWLECNQRIAAVEPLAPDVLALRLDRPSGVLHDLLAINPCAVSAPGCYDRHGEWTAPIGSAALRFVELREGGDVLRCAPFGPASGAAPDTCVDFVRYAADDARSPLDDLLAGRLDAVCDTWFETIPRERLPALRRDARVALHEGPGGAVTLLAFRLDGGPTADPAVRRRVAAALDRDAVVQAAELGCAVPCATWAPPTIRDWPASTGEVHGARASGALPALRLPRRAATGAEEAAEERLHAELERQLGRAGLAVERAALSGADLEARLAAGAWDLLVVRTLGVPYDPAIALTRFLQRGPRPFADSRWRLTGDERLAALVREAGAAQDPAARAAVHARVQAHVDREAVVVPLYVPRRYAVLRAGLPAPRLDHDLYRVDLLGLLAPA